jgi:nucleoside-diphosphate-sugar epimerase
MVQLIQNEFAIIGCGWLGKPLALALQKVNSALITSTRSIESGFELTQLSLQHVQFDAFNFKQFPERLAAKTIILLIPPGTSNSNQTYSKAIQSIVTACLERGTNKLVFASSTSVYESNSGLYTENGQTSTQERSITLLEAEEAILQHHSGLVLRFGGLINEQRNPFTFGKNTVLPGNEPVNMVHQVDAVNASIHLIQFEGKGLFNIVAPEHPNRADFYRAAFLQNNMEAKQFNTLSEPMSRIISSEKLLNSGYTFSYPNPLTFPMKSI